MAAAEQQTIGPPRRNTAIFIDLENLFGGYAGDVSQVPIRQILEEVEERARDLGLLSSIALTRAYANWADARLTSYRRELVAHGVEPVQVFSFGRSVRNAADIELVVDAMSVALTSESIDLFVIISGDGGFVPLLRKLHALGRSTIVAATKRSTTAALLESVADHFWFVGAPSSQPASARVPASSREVARATTPSAPPAAQVQVPPSVVTEAAPVDRAGYLAALRAVIASASVQALIDERDQGYRLQLLGSALKVLAPNLPAVRPHYPSLNVAVRHALTGTPSCLTGAGTDMAIVRRNRTPRSERLPDLR